MSRTNGYYILENFCRGFWPSSDGLRGLEDLILVCVHYICASYAIILEALNFKTYSYNVLFHLLFVIIGFAFVTAHIQILYRKNYLFKLLDTLSDFKRHGVPKKLGIADKKLRLNLKYLHRFTFLMFYIMAYCILLQDSCPDQDRYFSENGLSCKLILVFYLPFNVKPWQQTLLTLFQIHSYTLISSHGWGVTFLFQYSYELIVIRLEDLTSKINDVRFKKSEKKCLNLRYLIIYHQDILNLFNYANNFLKATVLLQRFAVLLCVIISVTGLILRKDIKMAVLLALTSYMLYVAHKIGERITIAGLKVAEAIYNTNWYDANVKIQKDVYMFTCIAQRPLIVQLPVVGSMSYASLANEYKRVYVWYQWVKKIYE